MPIYSIKDFVAGEFGPIFQAKNDQVAMRQWGNLIESQQIKNQSEYGLFRLGTYDCESGIITSEVVEVHAVPEKEI